MIDCLIIPLTCICLISSWIFAYKWGKSVGVDLGYYDGVKDGFTSLVKSRWIIRELPK